MSEEVKGNAMTYMTWDDSLDTGIAVIDSQHKQIVDYINRLHSAIKSKERNRSREVLDEVVNYTLTHFSFEEEMMKVAGYIHYDSHCMVHQAFLARISDYRIRLNNGEDVAKLLLSDLRIWLTNHIKNEDVDYAKCVNRYFHGGDDMGWIKRNIVRLFGK